MHRSASLHAWSLSLVALLLATGCGGESIDWEAHNWPSFGRDLSNTRHAVNERTISPDNVSSLVEKWRWPAEGEGPGVTGTPAVVDGVVYFGTWQGDMVALDALDGTPVWHVERLVDTLIDSSPCVTEDRIFVGSGGVHPAQGGSDRGRGSLVALDRTTGEELWSHRFEPHINSVHLWSSPVYIPDEDLVVVGVGSYEVVGLGGDADDPDAFNFRGNVAAVHASTGDVAWQVYLTNNDEESGSGVSVWSTAAVDTTRGMLFIGTGQNHTPPASPYSDSLIAIDYRAGELVWHRQYTEGDVFQMFISRGGPDYDIGAGPNLFTLDGRDLVGVADKGSTFAVMERDTGGHVWSQEELTPGSALGGVMGTAAYHDGRLYVVSNDLPIRTRLDAEENTSVVFALDAATGDPLWSTGLPSSVFGETTLANGVVYVGTVAGEVFGVGAESGDILWTLEGLSPFGGGVTVAAGRLFVPHGFTFIEGPGLARGGLVSFGLP
jgi:polyvinyl alcohol dehydrogenase (cytochrome)